MELTNVDLDLGVNASTLDNRFSRLNWITPEYKNDPKKEIDLLVKAKEVISEEKYGKIICNK